MVWNPLLNSAAIPVPGWGSTKVIETIDNISSTVLRQGYEYWLSKCQGKNIPSIKQIDLMEIYSISTQVMIKDAVNNGKDFRNRYFGTQLAIWYGFEATGKLISDYTPSDLIEELQDFYRTTLNSGKPLFEKGAANKNDLDEAVITGIYLPLLGISGEKEHLFCLEEFSEEFSEKI
jgi:hypothetical protein